MAIRRGRAAQRQGLYLFPQEGGDSLSAYLSPRAPDERDSLRTSDVTIGGLIRDARDREQT